MKINKYIEIVGSTNPRLNAMNKNSRQTILVTLKKKYTNVGITIVDNMQDLERLGAKRPDLVILGMKLVLLQPELGYDDSPKVWLSDYLTENGIDYTGSDTDSLKLEFDKPAAKQNVLDAGLASPAYFISTIKHPSFVHNLTFPLFVKPTNRGDSKGIDEQSVVRTQVELKAKILSIHDDCASDVLVEEYLSGREFSVAVIADAAGELHAMPIEIISPTDSKGNNFLSAAIKEADLEKVVAVAAGSLKEAINNLAMGAFLSLSARDYGRIDVRLDASGVPRFIEANLMPGLSTHGYLMRCFSLNRQISYDDMIFAIVAPAVERSMRFKSSELLTIPMVLADAAAPELVNTPV